ncbi:hypothetical protein Psi01_06230 [Planobispora siamensis]|uniref:DUF397 domain-containing protein n=1 Tax=Planobispora siamensis TaxID=936338 RepID=A0A8J3S9P3_9ACTN|nr:hypothetical protein Psi01_06230 [Planobispora siamensis]
MQRPTFQGSFWHTLCNNGQCPQVAREGEWIALRNSADGENGPVVVFHVDEWDELAANIGDFTSEKLGGSPNT